MAAPLCSKYIDIPIWNSEAHMTKVEMQKKDHTDTQEKTQQIVELYIEP